jgi:hypothetical protein
LGELTIFYLIFERKNKEVKKRAIKSKIQPEIRGIAFGDPRVGASDQNQHYRTSCGIFRPGPLGRVVPENQTYLQSFKTTINPTRPATRDKK